MGHGGSAYRGTATGTPHRRRRVRVGRAAAIVVSTTTLVGCGMRGGALEARPQTPPVGSAVSHTRTPLGAFGLPPPAAPQDGLASPPGTSGSEPDVNRVHNRSAPSTTQPTSGTSSGPQISTTPPAPTTYPGPAPTAEPVIAVYERYLYDLSGLLDTLNQTWIRRVQIVTTNRLAQASVRTAAAVLYAHEHGVGQLRDDHVSVRFNGSDEALLTDCQDEQDFYLVSDSTGRPDPAVQRGFFAGTAVVVFQSGAWVVDTYRPTNAACSY